MGSRMIRYFLVLTLVLVLVVPCWSWLWSRRRCGRVNCQWSAWSAWEPCNHPCGNAGEQSRSRRIARNPSCGGSPCRGPTSETQACNRFCYNGGTPQLGYCDCPDEFWGRCSEKPCTPIENCRHLVCTNGTNHQCRNCMYSYTPDIKAFRQVAAEGYINRICERLCSWRPDSRYCYPGACPNVPGSCRCAPGFEGPSNNCMTITRRPSITHCLGKLKKMSGGNVEDFRDIECNHRSLRMYTNIKATQLEMDWQSTFTGPSMSEYPQPYYVSDFAVGVIQARVPWTLHRAGGDEESGYIECSEGYSRTNPNRNLHHCLKHVNFNRPLNHGDRLVMSPQVQNGGYLRLNNYDGGISPEAGPHKFYSGLNTSHTATLMFDFTSPSHCSVSSHCSRKFLEVGKPYRKEAKVNAVYEGWTDLPSGIKKYEIEVFKMKPYGNVLGTDLHPFVKVDTLPGNTSCSVNLPAPGMYCFVLAVDDNAGNHRYSRTFVLFDNVNAVKVSPHGNTAIRVTSAAANTSHTWITNLSQQVRVGWKGHFMNQFHHEHKLLAAIRPHSPAIDEGYEVRRGQPPGVRSMEAIPSAHGVTAFHIQFDVDKNGGANNTKPKGTWAAVPNVQSEAASLRIPRVDGDSIRVFIKATDVMGNEVSDHTLVKVDSSPPEVAIIGLSKDGHRGLAVHKSTELFDMALELETYDDHSGVFSIAWVLHDFADQSKVHGQGHLAVVRKKPGGLCEPPSCACVPATRTCYQRNYRLKPDPSKMTRPEGSHDHDYMYTITVANNAKLVTVKTFKVTVDTSPPHPGVLKDSPPGSPDVDFQSHMTQHASWEGFFDKESGVMFYQYGFSGRCLTADDFSPSSTTVHRTPNTWASRSISRPGKYHVTVVAYNHALDKSTPVCSDGVTVDVTPPTLSAVSVEGLFVHESLVADPVTKDVYHLSRDRILTLLSITSAECRWNATEINITSYVIRRYENGTMKTMYLPPEKCAKFTRFVRTEYLHSEHKLRFSWFGKDGESGIADYETGLSTTGRGEPDLQPFRSTHNHRHYHTYHSGLSHGQQFYIHIKAVNKAGLRSHMVSGPVVIEAWASSDLVRKLEMTCRRTDHGNDVIVNWEQTTDKSLVQSIKTAYLTIVDMKSKVRVIEPMQVYEMIKSSQAEGNILIKEASLTHNLHPQHTYQVVMRTETVAGHLHDYLSHVYIHDHGPPSAGQVWHAQPGGQSDGHMEIQTNQKTVRVRWSGFHHPWYNVTYRADLQLVTGESVVTSPVLNHTSSSYVFDNISLQAFKEYRTVVTGLTPEGSSSATSTVLTVLAENLAADGVAAYDGSGCKNKNNTRQLSEHHSSFNFTCEDDMRFQLSQTTYSVHWNFPANINNYVKEVIWQVQRWSPENSKWDNVSTDRSVGKVTAATRTDVQFFDGNRYRSSLNMCHENGCFKPVYTSGFHVLTTPPSPGRLYVNPINDTSLSVTGLRFTWTPYHQIRLPASVQGISYYEWTVMVDYQGVQPRNQLFKWSRVTVPEAEASNYTVYFTLPYPLSPAYCHVLVLKGYNHVGLSSAIETKIMDCTLVHLRQNTVIDAVGVGGDTPGEIRPIRLERNARWPYPDQEFTPSPNTLQAVWPALRHPRFLWKAVSGERLQRGMNLKPPVKFQDFHCSSPATLACGETENNYINIEELKLVDGARYYICIYANETVIQRETSEERLPTVSACSDGIVVDAEPPVSGRVHVGSIDKHKRYLQDQSAILVHWAGFSDPEIRSATVVHTGISDYKIAIGTFDGGEDVKAFISVGNVNFKVISGLLLQQGESYYVSVRAEDFVGRSTTVTSEIVTIDITAPQLTGDHVTVGGTYHTSASSLHFSWQGLFLDQESGVDLYRWCVGTHPNHCDVTAFRETVHTELITDSPLRLVPGRKYIITVQAQNAAGLVATASSRGFIVDVTPPSPGYVLDGASSASGEDQDGQSDLRHLSSTWGGFHDTETGIWHYVVSVGSSPTFTDVMEETDWGLATSLQLEGLTLQPGKKYHTSVKACNWAGMCRVVISDGIIPDNSPPVLGDVIDGPSGEDLQYQTSRTSLCAAWFNMHDVHSGIAQVTWWAGTSVGADDILSKTILHVTERACTNIPHQMPLSTRIFTTVVVQNGAGLRSRATSDGFMVDISAPEVRTDAHFKVGSLRPGTQVMRTAVHVTWELFDGESGLSEHFVSLMSVGNRKLHFPPVKLFGDVRETIYSNVTLRDGERYQARVVGCNGAGICTTTVSQPQLVDHSRPRPGAFAAVTDHSVNLGRHRLGYMLYNTSTVSLAFLGFSDPHTGVIKYYITVGTFYDSSDLIGGRPVEVFHSTDDEHRDEGAVQKVNMTLTRSVRPRENIYVTVWAINAVGLESRRLHGTFRAVASSSTTGILELVRRCSSQSCEGHCTCAPQDQRCTDSRSCTNVKGRAGYKTVVVQDVQAGDTRRDSAEEFTYSQDTLAARWHTTGTGKKPHRYEWSVSLKGKLPGTGVMDRATEPIWFDAGSSDRATFTLPRAKGTFLPKAVYIFHVRAWYTESEVAVYKSRGVLVDGTPPDLSRSRVPMEVTTLDSSIDVDFTTNLTAVNVTWRGVFRDAQTSTERFVVHIGSKPGLSDVTSLEFPGHVAAATISGIRLVDAVWYVTTVVAHNQAGLQTTAHSDGFEVDVSPPVSTSAVVQDGTRLHDQCYQQDMQSVSSSWHGFYDLQSGIHHYLVCVRKKDIRGDGKCRNVGNALSTNFRFSNRLQQGSTYVTRVLAVDPAGHVSDAVESYGITIDESPPEPAVSWSHGHNLVRDGSFEKGVTSSPWTLKEETRRTDAAAKKGSWSMLVDGDVEQYIHFNTKSTAKLTFSTLLPPLNQSQGHVTHQQESVGTVTMGSRHFSFVTSVIRTEWQRHVQYVQLRGGGFLRFSSAAARHAFLLDDVTLEPMTHIAGGQTPNDGIFVEVVTLSKEQEGYVVASWKILDPESNIVDYKWAVGTVRGGVQIQTFLSAGTTSHGRTKPTLLSHGVEIHATVMATNGAGATRVVHSQPVIADFTPPEICCLMVNGNSTSSTVYVRNGPMLLEWTSRDRESRVSHCDWALGSRAGSGDLVQYTRAVNDSVRADTSTLRHGRTMYVTIRCTNTKELTSYLGSSEVVMVTGPPDMQNAEVYLVQASVTQYPVRGQHLPTTDHLTVGWTGFVDTSGIKHFQVKVTCGSGDVVDWTTAATSTDQFLRLDDINLTPFELYQIHVRAENHAGFTTKPVNTSFIVENTKPAETGKSLWSWWENENTLHMNWTDVFVGESTLLYEVNIGTKNGGNDVLRWIETKQRSMKVKDVDHSKEHYVTLTAINKAGLYHTRVFTVSYQ